MDTYHVTLDPLSMGPTEHSFGTETTYKLRWPSKCVCCESPSETMLKISDSAWAWFLGGNYNTASVPYCYACARHVRLKGWTKGKSLLLIGGTGFLLLSFLGALVPGPWKVLCLGVPLGMLLLLGVLGAIQWWASRKLRTALKKTCLSSDPAIRLVRPHTFVFQREAYARAFARLNNAQFEVVRDDR